VEPKSQAAAGAQTLAALGAAGVGAFSRQEYCAVVLFCWGPTVLPVFLTQVQIECTQFLPSLVPYRAEATLALQVIETQNPFYTIELQRQLRMAEAASLATVPLPEAPRF
jgi:hypothetical protein